MTEGRLAGSVARLETLQNGVGDWIGMRREADRDFRQYETQLNTLEEVLTTSATAVAGTLPPADADLAAVYEGCRLADRRTVWVERVWRFFSLRFDQRDGEGEAAACVRAADEVVWSCWRPCFKSAPRDARPPVPGPVPLPYLDAVHAPEAFPPGLVPADLAAVHADAPFVSKHLRTLPVPTLRVPATAADEPWLLGLVAHETAHHLQSAAKLVAAFREAVEAAVLEQTKDKEAVERWSAWSVELFADIASVAMLGPWALWPIAELEWRNPAMMRAPRAAYPPAHVRLRLLAATAQQLKVYRADAWPAGTADGAGDLPDMDLVDAVIEAGMGLGPPGFRLADWVDFRADDFQAGGEVDQWRSWFQGGPLPATPASVRGPRLVAAGIVAATADARRLPPAERATLLRNIRDNAFGGILRVRALDRRSLDSQSPTPVAATTGALARALVEAGEDDLVDDVPWPEIDGDTTADEHGP